MDKLLCSFCIAQAEFICAQCLIPYCSYNCQLRHWAEHKRFCQKLPSLMQMEDVTENFVTETDKDIGCLLQEPQKDATEEYSIELNQEANHIKNEEPQISVSDFTNISSKRLCQKLSSLMQMEDVTENFVTETDKDIGCLLQEPQKDATEEYSIEINQENSHIKNVESQISVSDFNNISSKRLCQKLSSLQMEDVTDNFATETDEDIGCFLQGPQKDATEEYSIELNQEANHIKNEESQISVSDFTNISSKRSSYFLSALTYIELPTPVAQLKIVNLSNLRNSLITVRDYNNQDAYDELEKRLDIMSQECGTLAKDYKEGYAPEYGELCLALNDADYYWYRAVCFKVSPDGQNFFMQHFDYGSCDSVPKGNIMPIIQKYLFPTCVHTCRIVVEDVSKFTRQLPKLKFFQCEIVWNEELQIYDILRW